MTGEPAPWQDDADLPVFMLAAVHEGRLWIAPLGAPCDLSGPLWVQAGPAPPLRPGEPYDGSRDGTGPPA